jgi:PTH2 family peptidyl-tRNA hydrolase
MIEMSFSEEKNINNTKPVKQVIVMRKDLGMRKGKMIAQGAHSSISFLSRKLIESYQPELEKETDKSLSNDLEIKQFKVFLNKWERKWIEGKFTKICVYVNSELELLEIHKRAIDSNILVELIKDAGLTEFKGIPTLTCLAIGPDDPNEIDKITGHLPLL